MPVFICPNCRERTVDVDGYEGFTTNVPQCRNCGFGFLFQLLEDYYPAPSTGFVVCDQDARVLAVGRGVFEQLALGPHAPSGFKSILDMAQ